MSKQSQLENALATVDKATSGISDELQRIILALKAKQECVTAEDLARLEIIANRLKGMGTDPENPDPGAEEGEEDTGEAATPKENID